MVGATDPKLAKPGAIRSDYGIDVRRNLIHASDSEESAKREIALHFPDLIPVVPNRGSFESKISTGTDMNITISKK